MLDILMLFRYLAFKVKNTRKHLRHKSWIRDNELHKYSIVLPNVSDVSSFNVGDAVYSHVSRPGTRGYCYPTPVIHFKTNTTK